MYGSYDQSSKLRTKKYSINFTFNGGFIMASINIFVDVILWPMHF